LSAAERLRRGFRVVDRPSTDGSKRVLSVHVRQDAPQFDGHFPGEPVLPAVAQLCDLVLPEVQWAWPDLTRLVGSPRLKFNRLIAPGDDLTLTLERASEPVVRFELRHAGGPCASGALRFGA
jgi:3-hydroxyacyl-[acyl-carrier-protein] dehydratase